MLIVRNKKVFYLVMDPSTQEMSLSDDFVRASVFQPPLEIGGSKLRKRLEHRAIQQGVLRPDEKLLMKPRNSVFIPN